MQREDERGKIPKVVGGDKPERESSENKQGQTLSAVLGPTLHFEESWLCCGPAILHP